MKTSRVMLLLLVVVVGMAAVEGGHMRKRFLFKEIKHAFESVGDFFEDTYNSAKDAVKKIASNLNFDTAVNALIPFIHSDMTVSACSLTCQGVSSTVLGNDADEASQLCGPLCEGALAKLEDMAGR